MTQLKTIWTWTYRITLSLILFILVYLLSAVILSHITVHSKFHPIPADQAGIDIYVRTNGMHTDLILPAQSSERDWYSIIPPADLHRIEDNTVGQTEYLSFGWGDKGFYLDTPTWADLKFSTAFIAATGLGKHRHAHRGGHHAAGERIGAQNSHFARTIAKTDCAHRPKF